jgi:hypothetical protein
MAEANLVYVIRKNAQGRLYGFTSSVSDDVGPLGGGRRMRRLRVNGGRRGKMRGTVNPLVVGSIPTRGAIKSMRYRISLAVPAS